MLAVAALLLLEATSMHRLKDPGIYAHVTIQVSRRQKRVVEAVYTHMMRKFKTASIHNRISKILPIRYLTLLT